MTWNAAPELWNVAITRVKKPIKGRTEAPLGNNDGARIDCSVAEGEEASVADMIPGER